VQTSVISLKERLTIEVKLLLSAAVSIGSGTTTDDIE